MIDWLLKQLETIVDLKIDKSNLETDTKLERAVMRLERDICDVRSSTENRDESSAVKILDTDLRKSQKYIISSRQDIASLQSKIRLLEERIVDLEFYYVGESVSFSDRLYHVKDWIFRKRLLIAGWLLCFSSAVGIWWLVTTNL
tara:strand:- start:2399 stop:2830 length:432 start_codon:yes stop_codon:yes gene_type:complete